MNTININILQAGENSPNKRVGSITVITSIDPKYFTKLLKDFLSNNISSMKVNYRTCPCIKVMIYFKHSIDDICKYVEESIKRVYLFQDFCMQLDIEMNSADSEKERMIYDLKIPQNKITNIHYLLKENLQSRGIKIDEWELNGRLNGIMRFKFKANSYYDIQQMKDIIKDNIKKAEKDYKINNVECNKGSYPFTFVTFIREEGSVKTIKVEEHTIYDVKPEYYNAFSPMIVDSISNLHLCEITSIVNCKKYLFVDIEIHLYLINLVLLDIETNIKETIRRISTGIQSQFVNDAHFKNIIDLVKKDTIGKDPYVICILNLSGIPHLVCNVFLERDKVITYVKEMNKLYGDTVSVDNNENFIDIKTSSCLMKDVVNMFYKNHAKVMCMLVDKDIDKTKIRVKFILYKDYLSNKECGKLECEINGDPDEILIPLKEWIVDKFEWYEGRGETPSDMFYTCCADYIKDGITTIVTEVYPGNYSIGELLRYTEDISTDFVTMRSLIRLFKSKEFNNIFRYDINASHIMRSTIIYRDTDCYDVFVDKDTPSEIIDRHMRIYGAIKQNENIVIHFYTVPDYVIKALDDKEKERKTVFINE